MSREARQLLLSEAATIVSQDRNRAYGEPEDAFALISDLWAGYLGIVVRSQDVANMMILLKVARLKVTPHHHDSWVDIAGYAACGGTVD